MPNSALFPDTTRVSPPNGCLAIAEVCGGKQGSSTCQWPVLRSFRWAGRMPACATPRKARWPRWTSPNYASSAATSEATTTATKGPETEAKAALLEITQRCWVDQVAPALVAFERLHGHLDVPTDFQVPASDEEEKEEREEEDADGWPKRSAGLRLGALVQHMGAYDVRKYVDLYKLDFPLRWTVLGARAERKRA